MSKDYYRVLGVAKEATNQEIKKSYRMLAMRFHPDRNQDDPSSAEYFKEITEAYGVLIDPDKRRTYDRQRGFSFNRETVFDDIFSRSEFRDVFDDLPIRKEWIERILNISRVIAYEAFVVGGTPGSVLRRSMVRLAAQGLDRVFHAVMDIHEKIVIPGTIAVTGGYMTLEYRPGLLKRGIKVKIPRNTTSGMVLRIQGMGRKNPLRKAGDLYLHVDIGSS
ncbi:MAG: DnaJ domain-containing protein [Desulfobacterota bacterium]|nr:DnaJ domain-containing protein [Thermodesulfobacteriota bacterium]